MHRLAHDLGALRRHDYGIGGGSMLCVGSTLLSMPELRDTEETDLYQRDAQPSPLPICNKNIVEVEFRNLLFEIWILKPPKTRHLTNHLTQHTTQPALDEVQVHCLPSLELP